jgi:ACS family hexuronate transporter-like MFS transporter
MQSSSGATSRKAWWLCGLLFGATTLNYLDRQTIAILAPTIQKEMHLDNAALGWLFSGFYYSYTFAQFGIGLILDRTNLRIAFGAAVLAWSVASGLTSLSVGFGSLLFFRLLLGIAESANWPASLRIVARALPPRDRSLGNGIFTSGTSIGALIAPSLIIALASYFSWRWAFLAVASLAFIWLAFWIVFTKDRQFDPVWIPRERERVPSGVVYRQLLRSARFWRALILTMTVNPCLYFNLNWLPTFFAQQRGIISGKELSIALTSVYLGLDLGYLACGVLVRLFSSSKSIARARRITFSLASILLCGSFFVPAVHAVSATVVLLAIVNFAIGIWISMYLTLAQEVSNEHVSTAAGLLGGAGALGGALAMWAVGRVTQATGSFAVPMTAVALAGLIAAAAGYAITSNDGPLGEYPAPNISVNASSDK